MVVGNFELVRPLKSIFDDLILEKRASQDEAAIAALAQFEANCMDQGFETVEDITSSAVFTETIDALAAGVSVGLLARFARRLGNHVWLPAPKTHAVAQRHKGLRPGPKRGGSRGARRPSSSSRRGTTRTRRPICSRTASSTAFSNQASDESSR